MIQVIGFDHVLFPIPVGAEPAARKFYCETLGLVEIPKPTALAGRGGMWLDCGNVQLHLGGEDGHTPSKKAHPALIVVGLNEIRQRLDHAGHTIDDHIQIPGCTRFFVNDPFGNLIEFIERHI